MSVVEEWKKYPMNLEAISHISLDYDCHEYYEQLVSDSHRLFEDDGKVTVRVTEIDLDGSDHTFDTLEQLENYLENNYLQGKEYRKITRVFFIPQQYSWGRFLISYEATCKLLTYLQVFPAFINILRAFGERAGFDDESHSEISFQENERSSEILYLIKHVEMHGRREPKCPWSFRQMGVYHKADSETGDTFLILNPSKSFRHRLRRLHTSSQVSNPSDIHMILLASAMKNWRWCITYLERENEAMVRN